MGIFRLSLSIIFLTSEATSDIALGPPSWQSDWTILRSQAGQSSLLELNHGLNELPIKGKALVRLLSGSNAGFSFEAVGSAQWDDDDPVIYCGVVFVYSSTRARLGAPTNFNAGDTGRIFCAGQQGWSDAGGNSQAEQEAEVKVLLWLQDSFPAPDIDIGWTHVDCFDPSLVFFEFPNPTGETLALVQLQIRVVDKDGVTWITEGIATDNSMNGVNRQQGGVIYSHDKTSIRIWIRKISTNLAGQYSVAMVEDGWGFRGQATNTYIVARTGDIRVYGWKTLGEPLFTGVTEVDLDVVGGFPGEMILNTKVWDPATSLITLQVVPLEGDNEGYVFYGTGVMPRAEYNNYPYGGVHFGYSQSSVRLFYPIGPYGCMMRIGSDYGGGMYQQCCRRARIRVTIWGESHLRPVVPLMDMHCHLTQHTVVGFKRSPRLCVMRCIVQPDCVALMVDQSSGDCTFLNTEEANTELDSYDTSQYAVFYPRECSKHELL